MHIIPAINADSFDEAEMQLEKIALAIANEAEAWIHLDVVDGKFAGTTTWGNPEEFKKLLVNGQALIPNLHFEIHLMIQHPEEIVEDWVKAGAERIIVHAEGLIQPDRVKAACDSHGATTVIAITPETPVETLIPYQKDFNHFQLLAVKPGFVGQTFHENTVEKIKYLRKKTDAIIEVDGGINLETAKLCHKAGADTLVSASYILGSHDPRKAYEQLKNT